MGTSLLLGLAVFWAQWHAEAPGQPSFINFCKIQRGMTPQEVQNLLGPPNDMFNPNVAAFYYVWRNNAEIEVIFDTRGIRAKAYYPPGTRNQLIALHNQLWNCLPQWLVDYLPF